MAIDTTQPGASAAPGNASHRATHEVVEHALGRLTPIYRAGAATPGE